MDAQTFIEEVVLGRHDDQLNSLFQALVSRVKAGSVSREWIIEDVAGVSIRESEMTVGEAERIEQLCGESWAELNPVQSARQFRAIIQAALESSGKKPTEAVEIVQSLKAVEAVDHVRTELSEPVPFGSPEQPTT